RGSDDLAVLVARIWGRSTRYSAVCAGRTAGDFVIAGRLRHRLAPEALPEAHGQWDLGCRRSACARALSLRISREWRRMARRSWCTGSPGRRIRNAELRGYGWR